MPENNAGVRSDPGAFNEADGFSPGIAAMTHMPGATITGLPTPNTIEESLDSDSPTVIIDANTGQPAPHWVDLDEYVVQAKIRADLLDFTIERGLDELRQEQALMLRPAIRLEDSTRYIVAIRGVLDEDGAPIPPSDGFAALRDGIASDDAVIESRRSHFEGTTRSTRSMRASKRASVAAWKSRSSCRCT